MRRAKTQSLFSFGSRVPRNAIVSWVDRDGAEPWFGFARNGRVFDPFSGGSIYGASIGVL